MIFLLMMIPYNIESGSFEIIDRNVNIFKDGVKVYSENLYIEAERGKEKSNFLELEEDIYVKTEDIQLKADRIVYYIPNKTLYGSGNIKLWREDTLKGDSLIYSRDNRCGRLIGNLLYIKDSTFITGNSGRFWEDSIVIEENPEFKSPEIQINSDTIVYFTEDSTFKFISNITFKGTNIYGKGGMLTYYTDKKQSVISEIPYIFQKKDSITGEIIVINHKKRILNAIRGLAINYTEEGRNSVNGDTVRIFYNEDSVDSVLVLKNADGNYLKNETGIKESR